MTREQLLGAAQMTATQRRVLTALANGDSQAEAAGRLNYALTTIKGQMIEIRQRLHARTTAHAVAIAVAAGVVTVGEINEGEPA